MGECQVAFCPAGTEIMSGRGDNEDGIDICGNTCTVPKVFPLSEVEPKTSSTMKLTKKKIRWIIREKEKKESSGIIAKIQHITRRRVDQLWKQYRSIGEIPVIGVAMGRPKKPVTAEELTVIDEA